MPAPHWEEEEFGQKLGGAKGSKVSGKAGSKEEARLETVREVKA